MPDIQWPFLAGGFALCLAGWTLYWVGLHLAGGVAGAAGGVSIAWFGAEFAKIDTERMWWLLPLGGALGFAFGMVMMRRLHRFFFFFVGAVLGMAVGWAGYTACAGIEWVAANVQVARALFVAVASVLCGMVMVWGSRWVVAFLTAVAGSLLVALSLSADDPLVLLVAVPLVPASFFFQVGILKRLMPKGTPEADEEE